MGRGSRGGEPGEKARASALHHTHRNTVSMSPVKTTTRLFLGRCCSVCRSQCSSLAGGADVVTGGAFCPPASFSPSPFTEGAGVGVVASLVMASADLLLVMVKGGIAMQMAGRCCDESVCDACEVEGETVLLPEQAGWAGCWQCRRSQHALLKHDKSRWSPVSRALLGVDS